MGRKAATSHTEIQNWQGCFKIRLVVILKPWWLVIFHWFSKCFSGGWQPRWNNEHPSIRSPSQKYQKHAKGQRRPQRCSYSIIHGIDKPTQKAAWTWGSCFQLSELNFWGTLLGTWESGKREGTEAEWKIVINFSHEGQDERNGGAHYEQGKIEPWNSWKGEKEKTIKEENHEEWINQWKQSALIVGRGTKRSSLGGSRWRKRYHILEKPCKKTKEET